MATAGLDVGNDTSCVALARKRGVDVIMNSESKRETPAVVSYGDRMRFVGVDGAARLTMNVKNTVTQVKRLIGRKYSDPQVQEDIKDFMFGVVEGPDGGCLIDVQFQNERRQFTPEQVMVSILKDLKAIAERDQGNAITDCAISVPVYFSEPERLAMLNSASLAGLKCLRLMNEPTATALNWGIFKSDLPEDKPFNVVFVDVGHASLQVSIVAFKKGQMEVLAHSWDRSLGGRDLDNALVAHFATEFKTKTGLDIFQNAKARYRMKVQVEKARQTLTINPQVPVNVECLMEDTDFSSSVTRDKFEELAAPVLDRVRQPCMEALRLAGQPTVHSVEMCGAASRTPSIVSTVAQVFGQEPKRTMNSKECVSRGCSLQAAMLSPLFQVRNFDVKDIFPFKVCLHWDAEDGPTSSQLFGVTEKDGNIMRQHYPNVKGVKFFKTEPFTVGVAYSEDSPVPPAADNAAARMQNTCEIAKVNVLEGHKAPADATNVFTKLSLELDLHGLVRCTAATNHHKVEVEEPAPAPAAPTPAPATPAKPDAEMADAEPAPAEVGGDGAAAAAASADGGVDNDKGAENGDASNMDTAEAAPLAEAEPAKPAPMVKKPKKVSTAVKFEQVSLAGTGADRFNTMMEQEGEMAASDALQNATLEAKNALEEYLLALRSHLSDRYAPYVKDSEKDPLIEELTKLEDWLYEEGEDEKKSVYEGKLKDLKAKGDPIKLRYDEAGTRDGACQTLSNACQHNMQWVGTEDPKYAHIESGDRETVQKESTSALQWLEDKMKAQQALGAADPPAVLTKDIMARKGALDNVCNPIINKPAPPPPKPEAKPAADAAPAEGAADAAPASTEAAAPAEGAGGAQDDAEMKDEAAALAATAGNCAEPEVAEQAMEEG